MCSLKKTNSMKEHIVDVSKYPGEFSDCCDSGFVYCLLCKRKIQSNRHIALIQHMRSALHQQNRMLKFGFGALAVSEDLSRQSNSFRSGIPMVSESASDDVSRPGVQSVCSEEDQSRSSNENDQPPYESILKSSLSNGSEAGMFSVHSQLVSRDFTLSPSQPPAPTSALTGRITPPVPPPAPSLINGHACQADGPSVHTSDHILTPIPNTLSSDSLSTTTMKKNILPVQKYIGQLAPPFAATAVIVASMSGVPVPSSTTSTAVTTVSSTSISPNMTLKPKRKRGRPRKYTLDLFPSQEASSASPHTRLSLPTPNTVTAFQPNISPQQSAPTSRAQLIADPSTSKELGTRCSTKTSQVAEIDGRASSNVSMSAKLNAASASLRHSDSTTEIDPAQPLVTARGLPPQQNLSQSVTTASASIDCDAVMKPHIPLECYDTKLSTEEKSATVTSRFRSFCPPTLPAGEGVDGGLIGRLLPQVEAAVCAARAARLPGPHAWTSQMVAEFIHTLPGCQSLAPIFIQNEIDGPALLCLEQLDLMSVLKLKLGPAVKVFGAIRALRQIVLSLPMTELSTDQAKASVAVVSCFNTLPGPSRLPSRPVDTLKSASGTRGAAPNQSTNGTAPVESVAFSSRNSETKLISGNN